MTMNTKIATVFGGTGFVGRQVVRELARLGFTVKVATRIPESAYFLRPCGVVGQIAPLACDYNNEKSIMQAVQGAVCVVNCIGILHERRKGAFQAAHVDIPAAIAKACKKQNVRRFVHISALGIEKSGSKYAASKREGEKAVRKSFSSATILRPSVIFGEDDKFFNMFAELARFFPALPLIGGGHTKFQPVYVGDVADAVIAALTLPSVGEQNPQGKTYELGGPETVTFRNIYERLFDYTGRRRFLIPLPWWLAKIEAFFLECLPDPPLTRDQVESLKTGSVVSGKQPGLAELGVQPHTMAMILPHYLERYRAGGRFAGKKSEPRPA